MKSKELLKHYLKYFLDTVERILWNWAVILFMGVVFFAGGLQIVIAQYSIEFDMIAVGDQTALFLLGMSLTWAIVWEVYFFVTDKNTESENREPVQKSEVLPATNI